MENETTVMQQEPENGTSADAFLSGFNGEQENSVEAVNPDAKEESDKTESDVPQEATVGQEKEKTSDAESGDVPAEKNSDAEGEEKSESPRKYSLKHLNEKKEVTVEEMIPLAEMGMDYKFIREKYDEAKPVMEVFCAAAKKAGMTIPEYLSSIRTAMKQTEGMSEEEARRSIDLEDREALISAKEQEEKEKLEKDSRADAEKEAEERRVRDDISRFIKIYPDVKPEEIPQEVWKDVNAGERSLVEAWQTHLIQKLKTENAAKEQKAANAARSTGSMRSSGKDKSATDPFLMGFNG